jgi:hypothetical protein
LRYLGGKRAYELFPPVVTNKGIRRLVDEHGLKEVIYLGTDATDTAAFRMCSFLKDRESCHMLSVEVPHAVAQVAA